MVANYRSRAQTAKRLFAIILILVCAPIFADKTGFINSPESRVQYVPQVDYALEISRGNVPGIAGINKFGRNPTVASGVEEVIWDGSSAYTFPTGVDITKINTSADVAGMRGEVVEVQGLDANWELVVQNVALDAANTTTLVTLATPLRRAFRMRFLSAVVGTSSITLVNDADNVLYANIEPGNNQTLMAIYTVPAGKTAYLTSYYAYHNPATNQDPTSNPVKLWVADRSKARQIKHVVGIPEGGGFQHVFDPYPEFTAKSDIYMTAQPVGKAADVSAGFDLYLVDN